MRRLLLVRHAEPDIDFAVPSSAWPLTERGKVSSGRLAEAASGFAPTRVVTSPEVKAVETGRILADTFNLPLTEDDRFAEHGAGPDDFIADYREFRAKVRQFFTTPDAVVFRSESCAAAGARFAEGIRSLASEETDLPLVVTHGRIMASWLAMLTGGTAWDIWIGLRLPDLIEVDLNAQAFRTVAFDLV
jgi:probable phosphoglycerate mutase